MQVIGYGITFKKTEYRLHEFEEFEKAHVDGCYAAFIDVDEEEIFTKDIFTATGVGVHYTSHPSNGKYCASGTVEMKTNWKNNMDILHVKKHLQQYLDLFLWF